MPQTRWLQQQTLNSHSSGGRKSKIKVPQTWILLRAPPWLVLSSHGLSLVRGGGRGGWKKNEGQGREGREIEGGRGKEREEVRGKEEAIKDTHFGLSSSSYKGTNPNRRAPPSWPHLNLCVCLCFSHSVVSDSCNPMDCNPPGSSVHGILQTRTLEWVATPFSRGSSWPSNGNWVSCIAGRFFTIWATRGAPI